MNQIKKLLFTYFVFFSFIFLVPLNISNVYGEDSNYQTGSEIASVCDGGLNIRDNIFLSAITLCIPGILENVEEYKQIKCEEVVCKYTSIANGVPATHCSKQSAYRICANVYGDLFALPGLNIADFVEKFKEAVVVYLSQPYVLGITTLRYAASKCTGTCDAFVWTGASLILAVNDIAASIQRVIDIFDAGFEPQNGVDYCAQIDSMGIVDEVNTILGVEE